MRPRFFVILIIALLNATISFSGQSSFVPGKSLGTLKLGMSEREVRKILGPPAKALVKKNRIILEYQNLPLVDASVTTLSFEKRSLTQIETSNSKALFQGKPIPECIVADFLTSFPDAKRVFVQLPDALDPAVYYFDSKHGIGMSFGIGMGSNFGKGSTEELSMKSVYVYPIGFAPIFPSDPIEDEQMVVIPGQSIGNLTLGMLEKELTNMGDISLEDEKDGYSTLYVGGKLVYIDDGRVAQISTTILSSSVANKTPLLASVHEFLSRYPDAKIEIRSVGSLFPKAFIYDRAQGIGLSFAVKQDQIVKGFFSKEIVPAYLSGSCLFVFGKGSEPPFIHGAATGSPPVVSTTSSDDSGQHYFLDETLSNPTEAFLTLPLFSTTFVGWEIKEAPLNISIHDFLTGLFPDEKISWTKSGSNSFSFAVETSDRLIEAKNALFLSFEIKQNPQRAVLFKLLVNSREVQGTEFINTITSMTHFALRRRGALPTKVHWN